MSIQITKGLAFCVLIAPVAAGASDWSSLLNNNPFLPPASAQTQAQPVQPLELRGVVVEGVVVWFTFFDSATKKWTTVRQGEDGDSLVVRSYDRTQDMVVLDVRGKKVTLSLKAAGNQSYGRSALVAGVASTAPQSHAQPFIVPAPPADEAKRLEQVAAVIRLRRDERKKQAASPSLTRS